MFKVEFITLILYPETSSNQNTSCKFESLHLYSEIHLYQSFLGPNFAVD